MNKELEKLATIHMRTQDIYESETVRVERAFLAGVRAGVEAAANKVEMDRYDLPGREAEWSRFIAKRIRTLVKNEDDK